MASTSGYSDVDLQRMMAREEHYESTRAAPPHSHKRKASEDLVSVGGQFQLSVKQTSWERSKPIDIPEQDLSSHPARISETTVEFVAVSRQQHSLIGSSQGRPRAVVTPPPDKVFHALSKEQFQLFQAQRSLVEQEAASGHRSESSTGSTRHPSPAPAMSEDHNAAGMGYIEPIHHAPTISSRPPTPPPPSVATTEDEYHGVGRGPASPHPWTTYERGWGLSVDGLSK